MLMLRRMSLLAVTTAAVVLLSSPADAALTINIVESGPDVVATTSGSISAGAEGGPGFTSLVGLVNPQNAQIAFAPALPAAFSGAVDVFNVTGPSSWGSQSATFASSSSGDVLGMGFGALFVADPYVIGSPLAATDTFAGQTLASLGLNPGTYVYSVLDATGAPVDTVTVNVGPAGGVPEPASWAMMLLGFAGIGFAVRRLQTVQGQPA